MTAGLRQWVLFSRDMPPSKLAIAIVEDDVSFRRAIERLLRAIGFEAQTFASAEEFLGNAAPGSHACLILDIHLPGMSAFELLDHLTASALRPPGSSSLRRTRTAYGSERPLFPTASTCTSHLPARYCWRSYFRCLTVAVPVLWASAIAMELNRALYVSFRRADPLRDSQFDYGA